MSMLAGGFGDFASCTCVLVGLTVIGLLVWRLVLAQKRRLESDWKLLANRMGLEYAEPQPGEGGMAMPVLSGEYRGREVSVAVRSGSKFDATDPGELVNCYNRMAGGRATRVVVRVTAEVEGRTGEWLVASDRQYHDEMVSKSGDLPGRVWMVGGRSFDSAVRARSSSADFAGDVFGTPELLEKLAAVLEPVHKALLVMGPSRICWESGITATGADTLTVALDTLCDLAEAAEGSS
ncbi:MAG: hypothetical protein ACYTGB_20340, partial [Planctomycetota bacterium]|jgi:hypothetical protein